MVINKTGFFSVRAAQNLGKLPPGERAEALKQFNTKAQALIGYAAQTLERKRKKV